MNIIIDRGPVVALPIEVQMSNRTYFAERSWKEQKTPHAPSSIELQALKRELEETVAYNELRAATLRFADPWMTIRLLAVAQAANEALEALAPIVGEARERTERGL